MPPRVAADPHPVISVCVPTFNRAQLLDQALGSILGEFEGAPIELIVSDNASGDGTEDVVRAWARRCPWVRYYRNEANIGLDDNAVACMRRAVGDYVFMFSDDDVLLPGSKEHLLRLIRAFDPALLYLNHRGFWETEEPGAVYQRRTSPDRRDAVYTDGFTMLVDLYLHHFSALIYRRTDMARCLHDLDSYRDQGYERGYAAVVLAHHVVLRSKGPFVFVGKCCVAVRNAVRDRSYNFAHTQTVDRVRHYQQLRREGLIREDQLRTLIRRHVMWTAMRLVTAMRCNRDPMLAEQELGVIYRLCKPYPSFYLYLYPVMVLPRFVLVVPYALVTTLKRLYYKVTRKSVFE